jgi:putative colanic acid biosynthesis acetyltransferase WcaF
MSFVTTQLDMRASVPSIANARLLAVGSSKAAGDDTVARDQVAQRLGSDPSLSAGARFSLRDFTGQNYSKGRPWPVQVLWMVVSRCVTMRWWCPNRLRVFILRSFGARIGTGTLIRHDVKIHWPWKLEIGHQTWIGESTWILNLEPVVIGSNTCISQDVLLCTGSHDRFSPTFEFDNAPIVIGDSVWIATRATILRGVHIADGATVGATAVVTGDIAEQVTILPPRSYPKAQA